MISFASVVSSRLHDLNQVVAPSCWRSTVCGGPWMSLDKFLAPLTISSASNVSLPHCHLSLDQICNVKTRNVTSNYLILCKAVLEMLFV